MKTIMKVMAIFLLSVFVLGCTDNPDSEWRKSSTENTYIIGSDLTELGEDYDNSDATRIMINSKRLYNDCEYALSQSQKYTVSPSSEEAKREYELSLKDFMTMAEISHDSAQRWEAGDISNAITEMEQIAVYLESGSKHLDACTALLP